MKDRKDTNGKPLPLLTPYEALTAFSKVSDYGNEKYGNRDSWTHNTDGVLVYSNAAARHLFKSSQNDIDKESGLPHLYHALWSVCAAIWHRENPNVMPADAFGPIIEWKECPYAWYGWSHDTDTIAKYWISAFGRNNSLRKRSDTGWTNLGAYGSVDECKRQAELEEAK